MILFLRLFARLLAFVLLVALALLGLAVAVFSIQGDADALSLPRLAEHLQLPELRSDAGRWLDQLEEPGPVALTSLGGGFAAIAAGVLLLAGTIVPARERLLVVEEEEDGRLAARRRAVAHAARSLAEPVRGVTAAKVRVRPSRRGCGGRLAVVAVHPRTVSGSEVEERVREALVPLSEGFSLRARVRARRGKPRVE
ncbi:MAG: hypothetical protein WKF65_10425 [Gaiellaceae bacterium]